MNSFFRLVACGLTLGRFAATLPFLYMLAKTVEEPSAHRALGLGLFYLVIAVSDLLDGFLARKAGAASHRWG